MKRTPIIVRLLRRVEAKPNGCLEFTGATVGRGYGTIIDPDLGTRRTHRVAWEAANGPIPDGLDVLHRCDNPPCVNVAHLFLGTKADNAADMVAKGRHANQRKTHCKRGHSLDDAYITTKGHRDCRTCRDGGRYGV